MGTHLVPDPPHGQLGSLVTAQSLKNGTRLWTCHMRKYPATDFNGSGSGGGGRFHWFDSAGISPIPILYAGAKREGALFETIFHNVTVRPGKNGFCRGARLYGRNLTSFRVAANKGLQLAELHDPGLLGLGLRPQQLTSTNRSHYARTCEWAQAIHAEVPWAQGLVWMSARSNAIKSYVFFGDRLKPSDLRVTRRGSMRLDDMKGYQLALQTGKSARIDLTPPPWLIGP